MDGRAFELHCLAAAAGFKSTTRECTVAVVVVGFTEQTYLTTGAAIVKHFSSAAL
jgi:hypothetical protein